MGRIAFRCFALAAALVFAGMAHAGHYAPVNGLKMYYEDDGHGRPLVMLHGGLCTIELCLGKLRAELATGRRIIAPELQGHGHTADIDRAMTMEQLTEDVAALLRRLDVRDADFFGFSIGGGIALRLAAKYPELVHKVVVFGAQIDKDGLVPGTAEFLESAKAADFPPEFREAYAKVAPDPARFAALVPKVAKTVAMDTGLGRDRFEMHRRTRAGHGRRRGHGARRARRGDVPAVAARQSRRAAALHAFRAEGPAAMGRVHDARFPRRSDAQARRAQALRTPVAPLTKDRAIRP